MKRVAIVGAGRLARVRGKALLAAGNAEICGIAARRLSSAQKFGAEIGCKECFDDFRELEDTQPAAVLVEVPHGVQDQIVDWALGLGVHVFIGGVLATTSSFAEKILQSAESKRLVVEAGFQARYTALWETSRRLVKEGTLGRLVMVRSLALWDGDPKTWYYQQEGSGGMPLTHMTYCFLNPVRWILGDPLFVSAFSNRIARTATENVSEETCVANMLFEDDVLYDQAAGYVKPGNMPAWSATFVGTEAAIELLPAEGTGGTLLMYRGKKTETQRFDSARDGFNVQAEVFLNALDGHNECRNTPTDTIGDIRVAEAIVRSARENGARQGFRN